MSRRTRLLLMVGLALAVWFALTLRWATQPLADTQSVGRNIKDEVVYQTAECGSVFDSSPTGGKVIAAPATPADVLALGPKRPEWQFARPPCELVHQQSRLVFGIDVGALLVAAAALAVVARHTRSDEPQLAAAA